jgi:hypothetical protein
MVCAECKKPLTVPESIDQPSIDQPESIGQIDVVGGLDISESKGVGEQLPTDAIDQVERGDDVVASMNNDAVTALLAAAFTDKIQDQRNAEARAKMPPPPPTPKKIEPPPKKKFITSGLVITISVFLVLVGVGVYFIFFFDWLGRDLRLDMVEQIEEHLIKTTIAIGKKDSQIEALKVTSLNSWSSTCGAVDAFLMTVGDIDARNSDVFELEWNISRDTINEDGKNKLTIARNEIKEAITIAEANLPQLLTQIENDKEKAGVDEHMTDIAINDAINLREELKFYQDELEKLKQQIKNNPDERPESIPFPKFDKIKTQDTDKIIKFNSDWTEEYFSQFAFSEALPGQYFTMFDGMRRLFGKRSLRVTLINRMPITITFPGDITAGDISARDITAGDVSAKIDPPKNELPITRTFNFAVRFPDITDAIMIGEERNTGQINEIKIKFINKAGHIEFKTKSKEYCDAIFYAGRGRFFAVDFSLEGDEFWERKDFFDNTKLTTIIQNDKTDLNEDEIKKMIDEAGMQEYERERKVLAFFDQIDAVELRILPASNRTTFWLDGITLSENKAQNKIDLTLANAKKEELQEIELANRKKRRARSIINMLSKIQGYQNIEQPDSDPNANIKINTPDNSNKKTNLTDQQKKTDKNTENAKNNLPKEPEKITRNKKNFFKLILHDLKGKIRANYNGRTFFFNANSTIPEKVEEYEIVQVSIINKDQDKKISGQNNNNKNNGDTNDEESLKISAVNLGWILECRTITVLELCGVGLEDSDVIGLASLSSLRSLNLSGNRLTFEVFPALKVFRKLECLEVGGIRSRVKGIDALGALKTLKTLNLSGSEFDSTDLNYCVTLADLEMLDLSGSKVGDRVAVIMQVLQKLKVINLSNTRITNAAIEPLTTLDELEELKLDGTDINEECLESINKIKNLKKVSALKTKITKNHIKQKINNPNIEFNVDK